MSATFFLRGPALFIDPHIHMVSRTTDDYETLSRAGCVAVSEPAFWAGFDRRSPEAFRDYFDQLTIHEPARAKNFGIAHYCWLCINPKEAENVAFAQQVVEIIPEYLSRPNVVGIGEVGLNRNTRNEMLILEAQLDLAAVHDQLVLVHTPHLEDKLRGTHLILDAIRNNGRLAPGRVLIDHVEEHTVKAVLDAGFWGGLTLYPETKATPQRAADMLEVYGSDRLWANSACDWGRADVLAIPRLREELRRRGHTRTAIERITLENPIRFMSQSPHFTDPRS